MATRELVLARTFVELADTLVAEFDVVELLSLVADRCVDVLEADAAGIILASPEGDLKVIASSNETMRLLELFELQAEEGPCLDCYRSGDPILNQDLTVATARWPRFAPVALESGFRSVHALPMRLRGTIIGALNLFNVSVGEMVDANVEAAQALADIATIAILQHRAVSEAQELNNQLGQALNSRILIEQSKGMIAQQLSLDMDEAFSMLRQHARNHNLRLADLASDVIEGKLSASLLDQPSP